MSGICVGVPMYIIGRFVYVSTVMPKNYIH